MGARATAHAPYRGGVRTKEMGGGETRRGWDRQRKGELERGDRIIDDKFGMERQK